MSCKAKTETINIGGEIVDLYWHKDYDVELPDLSGDEWYESADESWDRGYDHIYRWTLGRGIYLYVEMPSEELTNADISEEDIVERLSEWYTNSSECGEIEEAEYIQGWGIDGLSVLEEADESWDGPCRVWADPNYYQGDVSAPDPRFVRGDDGAILEFGSYDEAREWVDEYYSRPSQYDGIRACNVLAHGQAGAPILTIVQA